MSMISSTDPDFRICRINFKTLLDIQVDAEGRGWGTRWTSVEKLRSQVKEDSSLFQTFMREEREGVVRSYRCLLLFSSVQGEGGGGITTIDLDPKMLSSLERIDRELDVRKSLIRVFSLAMNGIAMMSKC